MKVIRHKWSGGMCTSCGLQRKVQPVGVKAKYYVGNNYKPIYRYLAGEVWTGELPVCTATNVQEKYQQ